jgi:hypothetical protein
MSVFAVPHGRNGRNCMGALPKLWMRSTAYAPPASSSLALGCGVVPTYMGLRQCAAVSATRGAISVAVQVPSTPFENRPTSGRAFVAVPSTSGAWVVPTGACRPGTPHAYIRTAITCIRTAISRAVAARAGFVGEGSSILHGVTMFLPSSAERGCVQPMIKRKRRRELWKRPRGIRQLKLEGVAGPSGGPSNESRRIHRARRHPNLRNAAKGLAPRGL